MAPKITIKLTVTNHEDGTASLQCDPVVLRLIMSSASVRIHDKLKWRRNLGAPKHVLDGYESLSDALIDAHRQVKVPVCEG